MHNETIALEYFYVSMYTGRQTKFEIWIKVIGFSIICRLNMP